MNVIGPNWPSTLTLRAALAEIPGPDVIWGAAGMNKLEQLERLAEGGVPVPPFTSNKALSLEWKSTGEVFGRFAKHSRGTDILPSSFAFPDYGISLRRANARMVRWMTRDFYSQYIPSIAEYRAHVWGKRCFRLGRKLPQGDPLPPTGPLIRSSLRGYEVRYGGLAEAVTAERRNQLWKLAITACTTLSYPHGAVDILESRDGDLFVLEVNTAPALGENTLKRYVEVITQAAQDTHERIVHA